jgi:poly-gamma-glutamate synthesis protein (capsule biosynthesis protein)
MLGGLAAPSLLSRREAAAVPADSSVVKLALCGDVMTGRGIDQVLPHPSDPRIYESYVKSALGYVELAESAHGPIPKPVDAAYIWGDALPELAHHAPDLKIINLETAVTRSDDYWRGKGINYRMHPANISCITAAGIDCCALANNHTLDFGYSGLAETIETLNRAQVKHAGAGDNRAEAEQPAIFELSENRRVLVFSLGVVTSGIPSAWAAADDGPGVSLLQALTGETVAELVDNMRRAKRAGDLVVVSLHWGGNWGYEIPQSQRRFAHRLIDEAGVDVVHGHSSHHPKGVELYRSKPILYGCGDFLNDYEGIGGYEQFRSDLVLMYFVTLDSATGMLARLEMTPFRIRRFRANRAGREEAKWLRDTLNRVSQPLGSQVTLREDASLEVR